MQILIPLVVLIFSAIIHEVMHGVAADKLGDPTARKMGRLTLNPIPHIDPLMSVLVPALLLFSGSPILFGAAKPVPINPFNFKDPKKDMALTALAGPLTNFLLAVAGAGLLKTVGAGSDILYTVLYAVILYNVVLAVINLIPIPPLDGSRVFAAFLPNELARAYMSIERFGIFLLFILLLFPIGDFSLGIVISKLISYTIHLLGV